MSGHDRRNAQQQRERAGAAVDAGHPRRSAVASLKLLLALDEGVGAHRHPRRSAVASLKLALCVAIGPDDHGSSTAISRGLIEAVPTALMARWLSGRHPRRSAVASLKRGERVGEELLHGGHPRRSAVASLKHPLLQHHLRHRVDRHPRRSAVASLKLKAEGPEALKRARHPRRSAVASLKQTPDHPRRRRWRRHPRRSAVASLKRSIGGTAALISRHVIHGDQPWPH